MKKIKKKKIKKKKIKNKKCKFKGGLSALKLAYIERVRDSLILTYYNFRTKMFHVE